MIPNQYWLLGWLASLTLCGWLMYHRGADDNEAAHTSVALTETVKVLDGFTEAAREMNGIAGQFTGISATLSSTIGRISTEFRNGARQNPLPADCRPDAFRVQSLSSAIAAANSAAGRSAGPAVPAAQ